MEDKVISWTGSQDTLKVGAEASPASAPADCRKGTQLRLYWVIWPNNHHINDISVLAADLDGIQIGNSWVKVFISYYQPPESCLSPGKLYYFEMAAKWERGRAPNTATIGHDSPFLSD